MADDRKSQGNRPVGAAPISAAIARPKAKPAKFVVPVADALPPVFTADPQFVTTIVEPEVVSAAEPVPLAATTPVVEPVVAEAIVPEPPVIAPVVAEPVISETTRPEIIEPFETQKVFAMNETMTNMQNDATDAMKSGTENAMSQGKAALEQVTTKSKEAMETGMKSIDEMTTMARGNVEALLASTRAATSGLESIAHQVADFSRKSFEETTAAARAMTTVKTPNELLQLQNDFAKTQFDAAITEMSKLSETLVKLAGEVFEPVQNRVAVATDKIKTAAQTTFQR